VACRVLNVSRSGYYDPSWLKLVRAAGSGERRKPDFAEAVGKTLIASRASASAT